MKAKSFTIYKNACVIRLKNKLVQVVRSEDDIYTIEIVKYTPEPEDFTMYAHSRKIGCGGMRLGRESFEAVLAAMIELEQPNQDINVYPL